jgi:hypothetical protein
LYQSVCVHNHPLLIRAYSRNGMRLDSNKVPDQPLEGGDHDPETGNAILIPCNPTFDISQPHMMPPTDLDRCDILPEQLTEFQDLNPSILSASHPGLSICHCKRRNVLYILCILSHETGPSSLKLAIWMTRTLSLTHGNWHLAFPVPAGGKQLQ